MNWWKRVREWWDSRHDVPVPPPPDDDNKRVWLWSNQDFSEVNFPPEGIGVNISTETGFESFYAVESPPDPLAERRSRAEELLTKLQGGK